MSYVRWCTKNWVWCIKGDLEMLINNMQTAGLKEFMCERWGQPIDESGSKV